MNHFAMGVFALYVVCVSLVRLLADRDVPGLMALKRVWGRTRGLVIHFVLNVVVPLVMGIIYLTRGIAGAY